MKESSQLSFEIQRLPKRNLLLLLRGVHEPGRSSLTKMSRISDESDDSRSESMIELKVEIVAKIRIVCAEL